MNISTEKVHLVWRIGEESGATLEDIKTHPIQLNHYAFQSMEAWAKKSINDVVFSDRYNWDILARVNQWGHFTDSTLAEKRDFTEQLSRSKKAPHPTD